MCSTSKSGKGAGRMERLQGVITYTGPGFLFARVEDGKARQDFFIHKSDIRKRRFNELQPGDLIEFTPVQVTEGEHSGKWKGNDAELQIDYIKKENVK